MAERNTTWLKRLSQRDDIAAYISSACYSIIAVEATGVAVSEFSSHDTALGFGTLALAGVFGFMSVNEFGNALHTVRTDEAQRTEE